MNHLRPVLLVPLLLGALVLTGCRKGPDGETLRQELQARLDQQFSPGTLVVDDLVRRGSYPFPAEGDDRDHVLIYFDAELSFARDLALANWDSLNVGSLVSVLGAQPQGVDGVESAGNAAGDVLHVYGSAAYVRGEDGWEATHRRPSAAAKEAKPEALPYQERLAELAEVARELNRARGEHELARIDKALGEVLAQAERDLARVKGWTSLAGGNPGGEYDLLAQALVALLDKPRSPARAFHSGGSVENARLVQRQEVRFGFVQNDIARMAVQGTGLFSSLLPTPDLVALCSLHPEAIQVVARADSGIRRIADLHGKRVDVGLADSGVRINALQVLRAAGLDPEDLGSARGRSMAAALAGLKQGDVDAVFLTSAFPHHELLALAAEHPVRLLPMDEELRTRVVAANSNLVPLVVPARTYPGQAEAVPTLAVTALVVTHRATPPDQVQALLRHLYEPQDSEEGAAVQAYLANRERALDGISIPLHDAAKEYFGK